MNFLGALQRISKMGDVDGMCSFCDFVGVHTVDCPTAIAYNALTQLESYTTVSAFSESLRTFAGAPFTLGLAPHETVTFTTRYILALQRLLNEAADRLEATQLIIHTHPLLEPNRN